MPVPVPACAGISDKRCIFGVRLNTDAMTIELNLRYHTTWGEQIKLRTGKKLYDMTYQPGGVWQAVLTGRELRPGAEYSYLVVRKDKVVRREWRGRRFLAPEGAGAVTVRDRWTDRPADSAFWSSAFSDVVFRRSEGRSFRTDTQKTLPGGGNVTFVIPAAQVRPGLGAAIVTDADWAKPILLDDSRFPWWSVTLDVRNPFEFKFVLVENGRIVRWEEGPNHLFAEVPAKGTHLVVNDLVPAFQSLPWRGAGTAVPVFSLRTEESFGVGEFHDLEKLVDWAVATGQNILQLLPINDTTMTGTWRDSYPYNAVSSFALHPQFIHLPAAGIRRTPAYKALQEELNSLPQVDYERVNSEKLRLLRKAYAKTTDLESAEYKEFVDKNADWLLPYAAYCILRDLNGTADFSQWGANAVYTKRKADAVRSAHAAEAGFWCWVQFLLDKQLKEAVAYAHRRGVALKGDLPIGVSRTSADAWASPQLFNMDSQAGAPPDAFAADGQNWGFPTYNWDAMAAEGYAWWKARLRKMNEYFDAYRIDHILGFFRIWEIPVPYKSGLMGHFSPALPYSGEELMQHGFELPCPKGEFEEDVLFVEDPHKKGWWHPRIAAQDTPAYARLAPWQKEAYDALYNDFFYHRHNQFWKARAYEKLPALLRSTGMLSCGEDLGMIPATVPETMADLGILSLEIQRMPKSMEVEFGDPATYPYNCVCATGTHDTSTLRAWWEEDREASQRYYNTLLGCTGEVPATCEPWVAEMIVSQHLASPAMLCILPLQDWLSIDGGLRFGGDPIDERINIPANPRHYWRYRMHCTLESLLSATSFNTRLHGLITASGRGQ